YPSLETMVTDDTGDPEPEWLRNLPLRAEEIGFSPDEMVACASCGKANAPNRATCLYCGAPREGGPAGEKLEIRAIEHWENGFNVVLLDVAGADVEKATDVMVEIVSGERESLKAAFESGRQIPLIRVATDEQAGLVDKRLGEH